MDTMRVPMSKSVLLLAAAILPVQQSISATECCREAHDGGLRYAAASEGNCCSQKLDNCCNRGDGPWRVCCQHGQTCSDSSKPYPCSGMCGRSGAPMAVDLTVGIVPPDDELAVTVILTIAADTSVDTASNSLRSTTSTHTTSGSHRCVLLCRHRL